IKAIIPVFILLPTSFTESRPEVGRLLRLQMEPGKRLARKNYNTATQAGSLCALRKADDRSKSK
ncbi:MAG: hypothetical protein ABIK28_02900, partial [Planctomycetota bacterium]